MDPIINDTQEDKRYKSDMGSDQRMYLVQQVRSADCVALDNSYHQVVANSDLEKLIEIHHQTISTIYHKDKHNEKS